MMNRFLTLAAIYMLLSTAICSAAETITICGTGDSQNLLRELARAYEQLHPGADIHVPESIGSTGGIKATVAGKCDMGRTARPLKEKEKIYNLRSLQFALSPVVFIANKTVNQVKGLSTEQIVGIFSGQIRYWNLVGGPAEKIFIANREKGDSSRSVLEEKCAGFAAISDPAGQTIYSTPETIRIIGKTRFTIGYAPLSQAKTNSNVFILSLDGIDPSLDNVAEGIYPLASSFSLVWLPQTEEKVQGFLQFLRSETARGICRNNGTVSTL